MGEAAKIAVLDDLHNFTAKKKRETTRSETGEAGLASKGLSKVPEGG